MGAGIGAQDSNKVNLSCHSGLDPESRIIYWILNQVQDNILI